MAQQYQQQPQQPRGREGSMWKNKYRSAIPALLFVLVLVVLAWKIGWLCTIPGLGGICGGEVTDILIVGEDKDLINTLDEIKVGTPMNYKAIDMEEVNSIKDPSYLDSYDVIILTEELGEEPGELPGLFRNYVTQRLSDGADLIMYGLAGSKDPQNPNVDGWTQHGIDQYVPVECQNIGPCEAERKEHAGSLMNLAIQNINHPILKEFGTSYEFGGGTIQYVKVNPSQGSTSIAQIEVETAGVTATPAIVEKEQSIGGSSIYFAYHPSLTPIVFKNTINYIS